MVELLRSCKPLKSNSLPVLQPLLVTIDTFIPCQTYLDETDVLGFQADGVADGAADALAALCRHALGHGHSANSARLRAQYPAALARRCMPGTIQGKTGGFNVFNIK